MSFSNRVNQIIFENDKKTIWISAHNKWRTSATLCRRQDKNLKIKLRDHYETFSQISIFEQRNVDFKLKTLTNKTIAILSDIARNTFFIFFILSRFAWWLLRWFICDLIDALLCLQLIIMIYTISNKIFLFAFCQQKLFIVRVWICNTWNQVQINNQQTFSNSVDLNESLESVFQSNEKTRSYDLSFHFADYETTIRFFKISLLKSKYFNSDQKFFLNRFNEFIDQTIDVIEATQLFHVHMIDIINMHVTNIKYVVQKLNDDNFLFRIFVAINDTLTKNMIWLNSWHLIYFSIDIESFQQFFVQIQEIRNLKLMQNHVNLMLNNLTVDIQMIFRLKKVLLKLERLMNVIEFRINVIEARNAKKKYNRHINKITAWMKRDLYEKSYEIYQMKQRRKWFAIMKKKFVATSLFVVQATRQLETTYEFCQAFSKRFIKKKHNREIRISSISLNQKANFENESKHCKFRMTIEILSNNIIAISCSRFQARIFEFEFVYAQRRIIKILTSQT